jgi:NADP-dependent 3-hydroxy acid dehydrogenase YdfG
MSDIPNGVALITGAAQGLGRSIALRLATDGFDIALNDLPAKHEQLNALAAEIENLGRKTCIVPADVSEENQVKQMIDSTVEQLGGLYVVCSQTNLDLSQYADYHSTDGRKRWCSLSQAVPVQYVYSKCSLPGLMGRSSECSGLG